MRAWFQCHICRSIFCPYAGFFKRNASIPTVGYEPEVARAAFNLSDSKKLHDDVIKGQKGYFVIHFLKRQEPSPEGFEKEKAQIKARLQQQKTFKAVGDWLTRLKDESESVIAEGFWKS